MPTYNQVLWTLDNQTDPLTFERLCCDMLAREGYRHLRPGGRTRDLGRDAEVRFWTGASDQEQVIAFQFSTEQRWEQKLRKDAKKVRDNCSNVKALVFVTSYNVTVCKRDSLREEFTRLFDLALTIYEREWLRLRLEQRDQDLAQKYLGLDILSTTWNLCASFEFNDDPDGTDRKGEQHTSFETIRASLLDATKKEPFILDHWHRLAKIEYQLRNYDNALEAANRALQIKSKDAVVALNVSLLRGAILAEKGIQIRSKPLLIEAKDCFQKAVEKLHRAADHYNLANVVASLGERTDAEKHYRRCLELQPNEPRAWKNLGSLLFDMNRSEEGMRCFEEALHLNPKLVEAHLCKAGALLAAFNKPTEALASYEAAFQIDPSLDRKCKYWRYWKAQCLVALNRYSEALAEIQRELDMRPEDMRLLTAKAKLLSELWRQNQSYEKQALEFFKFRARSIENDYAAFSEIIALLLKDGLEQEAWNFVDEHLGITHMLPSELCRRSGMTLEDLEKGFRLGRLYSEFRTRYTLEDHCATLHRYGLSPDYRIIRQLEQILVGPFGMMFSAVKSFGHPGTMPLATVFSESVRIVAALFPSFGCSWLSKQKPETQDQQINLLSTGIYYLFDVVVAEAARQFGFLTGYFNIPKKEIEKAQEGPWKCSRAETGVMLLEEVTAAWKILKTPSSPTGTNEPVRSIARDLRPSRGGTTEDSSEHNIP